MLNRRQFLFAATTATAAAILGGCSMRTPIPHERSINFGFEDVVTSNTKWHKHGEQLQKAHVNAVSLAIGRPDWLAFEWDENPDISASLVQETGEDYIEKALKELKPFLPDDHKITLTLDTLLPGWIQENPKLAGKTTAGKRSSEFASVAALTDGDVAKRITQLVKDLAARYEPHSIALTELMFDDATFGDDDLKHYKRTTDADDWPRRSNGNIDERHDSIGEWRSKSLAHLVSTLHNELNNSNTNIDIDVRAPWEDPTGDRSESGHNYELLLQKADRIVIWNYFGINEKSPKYGRKIAAALHNNYGDRFVMSTGLWGTKNNQAITPDDLRASLQAAAQGGANAVSVSPAKLMTPEHWKVLEEIWRPD